MLRLGFIGLGTMGKPMAINLLKAGYPMDVFDLNPEPVAALKSMGAGTPSSIGAMMAAVDCVITIVPADPQVEAVYLGTDGICAHLRPGQIAIEMTTCHPKTLTAMSGVFAKAGAHLVDAPVSGGRKGAEGGSLSIMVGCEEDMFARVEPLLSVLGNKIFHAGALGAGKSIKLINQLMASTHMAVLAEGINLAKKLGISPEGFYEVVKESSGHSRMFDLKMQGFILPENYTASFKLALMHKDLALALALAQDSGQVAGVASAARELYEQAMNMGLGDYDMSALVKAAD